MFYDDMIRTIGIGLHSEKAKKIIDTHIKYKLLWVFELTLGKCNKSKYNNNNKPL